MSCRILVLIPCYYRYTGIRVKTAPSVFPFSSRSRPWVFPSSALLKNYFRTARSQSLLHLIHSPSCLRFKKRTDLKILIQRQGELPLNLSSHTLRLSLLSDLGRLPRSLSGMNESSGPVGRGCLTAYRPLRYFYYLESLGCNPSLLRPSYPSLA